MRIGLPERQAVAVDGKAGAAMRTSRGIHQHMHPAETVNAFADEALAIFDTIDVARGCDSDVSTAILRDLFNTVFELSGIEIGENNARAGSHQSLGHNLAKPLSGSRDDRDFAVQINFAHLSPRKSFA